MQAGWDTPSSPGLRLLAVEAVAELNQEVYVPLWSKSNMETFFPTQGSLMTDCEVIIGDGRISVSYLDNDRWMTYTGPDNGTGHFSLKCEANGGEGTLHYVESAEQLEGSWNEAGFRGMWQIDLDDGEVD